MAKENGTESKLLLEQVDVLEGLVRQQQDFIDNSTLTWQRLLEREQAISHRSRLERDTIENKIVALDESRTSREHEIADLHRQLAEAQSEVKDARAVLEHERAVLSQRRDEIARELDERTTSLTAARAELQLQLDSERSVARDIARQSQAQQLAEAELAEIRLRADRLAQELAKVENMLRQRHEETDQAWAALGQAQGRIEALQTELADVKEREAALQAKLIEANGWVFRLAGERTAADRQLSRVMRDRDAKAIALEKAAGQLSQLRERLQEQRAATHNSKAEEREAAAQSPAETVGAAAPVGTTPSIAAATPDVIATAEFQPTQQHHADETLKALLQPVLQRDKQQLLRQLLPGRVDGNAPTAPLPAADNPQKDGGQVLRDPADGPESRPMPIAMPPRNAELERQLDVQRGRTEWLRQVAVRFVEPPRQWRFMPSSWRRKQTMDRLVRDGLFDPQAYLERYGDVADAGIDPLQHYLLHGMNEGRQR